MHTSSITEFFGWSRRRRGRACLPKGIRPVLDRLEARRMLDATIFQMNGQAVEVRSDALSAAAPITIRRDGAAVTTGDQLVIKYAADGPAARDLREVLVVDTNGFLRLRHLDGLNPPGTEDPFGTSLKLPPGLIVEGSRFFLTMKVEQIDLITNLSSSGILGLRMTGRPADGPSASNPNVLPVAVAWDLTLYPPTNSATHVRLTTTTTFETDVTLSESHRANAEAFRALEYSSSNVDPSNTTTGARTRDADRLRVTSANGNTLADVNLNTTPRNQLIFAGGTVFDGAIELNQTTPAPLNGDPPNMRSHLAPDGADYRAQGFIALNAGIDENSDNVGVWASRTFAAPRIAAGSRFMWTVKVAALDDPTVYANTAPTIGATPDTGAVAGVAFSRIGHFADPDVSDVWNATVDYGDGQGPRPLSFDPGKSFALDHIYQQPGDYRVVVTVRDDENATDTESFTVRVDAGTEPTIAAPTNLTATLTTTTRVLLAWKDNANNESGYRVERSADARTWSPIASNLPANTTSLTDSPVSPGTVYVYRVIAFNGSSESGPATVSLLVPSPTAVLSARFDRIRYFVSEGTRFARIVVLRAGEFGKAIQVRFATADDTARVGSDYRAVSKTIRMSAKQSRVTVMVPILNDRFAESNETIRLILSSLDGTASPRTAELVIRDNDRKSRR